jgi:hypothetical protein
MYEVRPETAHKTWASAEKRLGWGIFILVGNASTMLWQENTIL